MIAIKSVVYLVEMCQSGDERMPQKYFYTHHRIEEPRALASGVLWRVERVFQLLTRVVLQAARKYFCRYPAVIIVINW